MALLVCSANAGCLGQARAESLGNDHWSSPLDSELREGIAALQRTFDQENRPIQIVWAGTRDSAYRVERGPMGEALRESVPILYVLSFPARKQCFLSPEAHGEWTVRLAREHMGSGKYGPPGIWGLGSINKDGEPVGQEIACDAVQRVAGGVRAGSNPLRGNATTPSFDVNEALASLSPKVSRDCREVAKHACGSTPAGADPKTACEEAIASANRDAGSPDAEKACTKARRRVVGQSQ